MGAEGDGGKVHEPSFDFGDVVSLDDLGKERGCQWVSLDKSPMNELT
jgi:hypothetical protein